MSKIDWQFLIGAIVIGLTLQLHSSYQRWSVKDPEYLRNVSDRVKKICIEEANEEAKLGKHNVGILGGPDAEYLVTLSTCVRRFNPDA